jgi:hydrogenase expression/formation protein HypD
VLPRADARAITHPARRPAADAVPLDGFIGPAHVSIDRLGALRGLRRDYRKPVVIAGFEPLDVMQAILMLVRQVNEGRAEVENEFTRAVTREGNPPRRRWWPRCSSCARASSGAAWARCRPALRIRAPTRAFDAEALRAGLPARRRPQACECGAILRGVKQPRDCKLFGTVCTPENPMGSCMVSSEGACAAHYSYGRFRTFRWSRMSRHRPLAPSPLRPALNSATAGRHGPRRRRPRGS